jgi:hypothetical protein
MVIALAVFADLEPLWTAGPSVFGPIIDYVAPHAASVHTLLAAGRLMPTILAGGAGILVVIWAMDRIFDLRRAAFAKRGR